MSQNFLFSATFHLFLVKLDQDIAQTVQQKGCPYCGSQLHLAEYPRSPLGIPTAFRASYEIRFSFCCSQCRKRTTPESIRFFGRRWFPAPFFMFVSALILGLNERRLTQVKRHLGVSVSESTWKRWRRWWRKSFITTPFWQQAKGMFLPTDQIVQGPFPRILLTAFQGSLKEKLILLLRFLLPLTIDNSHSA